MNQREGRFVRNWKTKLAALHVAVLCVDIAAGQAPATRIGKHRLGETIAEWNSITHDLDEIDVVCGKNRKLRNKQQCELLIGIRDGSRDEIASGGSEDRSYSWKFIQGKLAAVTITIPGISAASSVHPNIQAEIGYLVQSYGTPAVSKTVPYQNAFGAAWECLSDTWPMPDGSRITAREIIGNPLTGDPRRELLVTFLSAESVEKESQSANANPYKR